MKNILLALLCVITGGFWLIVMIGSAMEEHADD